MAARPSTWVRIFGVAATYVGTVIGAGFASGQEIWTFFGRFGPAGFAGLALAGAVFAVAGGRALALGAAGNACDTHYQILRQLFGPLAPAFDAVLLLFLTVLGGVMLAGAGALVRFLGWPSWAGILATAALGLLVLAADLPALVSVNGLVVPCLLLVACLISLGSLRLPPLGLRPAGPLFGWPVSALLYASYNTIMSLPVLAALGRKERCAPVLRRGGLWGAACLTLAGGLVFAALLRRAGVSAKSEVPMAAIASSLGAPVRVAFSIVLWAEMFTTLIADLYGVATRLRQLLGGPLAAWSAAAMAAGIVTSRLGFARLIGTAYPAFGLICLAVLARLIMPARTGPRHPARACLTRPRPGDNDVGNARRVVPPDFCHRTKISPDVSRETAPVGTGRKAENPDAMPSVDRPRATGALRYTSLSVSAGCAPQDPGQVKGGRAEGKLGP
ncbi:MAG: hypothetical protein ACM3X6_07705 [Patescibacteria group bacterium]